MRPGWLANKKMCPVLDDDCQKAGHPGTEKEVAWNRRSLCCSVQLCFFVDPGMVESWTAYLVNQALISRCVFDGLRLRGTLEARKRATPKRHTPKQSCHGRLELGGDAWSVSCAARHGHGVHGNGTRHGVARASGNCSSIFFLFLLTADSVPLEPAPAASSGSHRTRLARASRTGGGGTPPLANAPGKSADHDSIASLIFRALVLSFLLTGFGLEEPPH